VSDGDLAGWYRAEAPRVRRYLLALCSDPALAEELTQETFLQALLSLGGYRGGGVRAYLFGVARKVFANHVRRESRRRAAESLAPDAAEEVDRPFAQGEDWLPDLPPEDALLLMERAVWQRPYAEIARDLGRSETWARVRYFRLMTRLRAELKGGRDGDEG